mmetsp:Transcript_14643/g.17101  ORF Transcript_14643/g.17101 Transcript_14643/m.17101 type:complete len:734 (-) Transcript_14643:1005-3206(-)
MFASTGPPAQLSEEEEREGATLLKDGSTPLTGSLDDKHNYEDEDRVRDKYGITGSILAPYMHESDNAAEGTEYQELSQNFKSLEVESDQEPGFMDTLNNYDLDENEHGFFPVSNLDEFFVRLYVYYRGGGFSCIVADKITWMITLGFTIIFSTFLLGFLNWEHILECHDESSCKDFEYYVVSYNAHSKAFTLFIVLYFVILSVYWLWALASLIPNLKQNWEIRQFYHKQLNISTRNLQTMKWRTVIERVVDLQVSGKYRILINGDTLNAKNVAQRIMRKENYFIALVNHNILPFGSGLLGQTWFLGNFLEKILEICVLDRMFSDRFILRREFVNQPQKLRRRFIQCGILTLVTLPFSLGFMFIYFFLRYAQEFHLKQNYLGPRWWSPHALWQFREFNELDHLFEKRTRAAMKYADAYIKQFPTPIPTTIASGFSFISGSFLGVLLLFTLLDEAIVFHIKLGGRDLVWYVAVLTGILALARALVPPVEDTVFNPSAAMRKLVAYTHYLPEKWRSSVHTYDVRDEFSQLFQYKVVLLLREITCVLSTPYILCFVLPCKAEGIIEFISSHTTFVKGIGDVCVFSELDIERHGDPLYGGKNQKGFQAKDGKLEKSWLNFNTNYRKFSPASREMENEPEAKNDLRNRLVRFQQEKTGAYGLHSPKELVPSTLSSSVVDSDIANFMHSDLPDGSISSERGMFESAHAANIPLDKVAFDNQENYFFWLEEFRDSNEKELP